MHARWVYVFVLVLFSVRNCQSQELTVASFNLRYDNRNDSGNRWSSRLPAVAGLIRFHGFDVFGTQEGLLNQLKDLKIALPEYDYYGKGRDDGRDKGEHSAIFFQKEKFALLAQGDFWLSETPEKPGPGWDAQLNRICSWVKLTDKINQTVCYFFNVHYDHQGTKAREESSKLLLRKIPEIAGDNPVILMGDFNGGHESSWYQTLAGSALLMDTYKRSPIIYANNGSFNGFGSQLNNEEIIDHLFTSKGFSVLKWGVLTDTYHGKYPSDHFPVMAKLWFNKK